jgi:hypothetical protein
MRSKTVDRPFLEALASRPADFTRKLDFLLRTGDPVEVLDVFRRVTGGLTEKYLFEMNKYLGSRGSMSMRMFLPKGAENKIQIVEDTREPISPQYLDEAQDIIQAELLTRFVEMPAMGRVWIDPALKQVLLPFNRRGDSSTNVAITKGNRYPFTGDVIRMFVHWNNGPHTRVDVDLSIVLFDHAFQQVGHIAYTNLSGYGCYHSGDIQNAPNGASEFIDFEVDKMARRNIRYIAMSVISYTGQTFDTYPCFAGFMERDAVKSGAVYQPETVALKFDISAKTTSHNPIIFDINDRSIIFADMASAARRGGRVASETDKQAVLTEALLSLPARKPTIWDVIYAHARARGTIVKNREDADRVIDGSDTQALLAEFVG